MTKSVNNDSNALRSLLFWAACVALILSFAIFVLEKSQITNFYTKPVVAPQETTSNGPTNIIDYPIANSSNDSTPLNKESGTDKPINNGTISGTINYKAVVNDTLVIRVTIYQIINSGTCSLKLTRASDGKQFTKTANVITNPSSATCGGFDVPVSDLGTGKWDISVLITSGDKTGEITSEVTI